MEYFVGLDVSIEETAVCVVDDKGTVAHSGAVATDPERSRRCCGPMPGGCAGWAMRLAPCRHGCTRTGRARSSGCLPGNASCACRDECAA